MGLIDYNPNIDKLRIQTVKAKKEFFASFMMEETSIIKERKQSNSFIDNPNEVMNGDKKLSLIRMLLNKILPRTSDDQKAYLYIMEIISAKKIYGDEFEQDVEGIMNRNGWTVMNDKAIMFGPRR